MGGGKRGGGGWGKTPKKFPQEIINNKIIFLRILAKKYIYALGGKKKDFHLNYMFKKEKSCINLACLKITTPLPFPTLF